MLPSGRRVAILDACVLYPAPLRDFLLSLAEQDLYRPKWSRRIQDEWVRNLLKNRPDLTKDQLVHTTSLMNKAFPDAQLQGFKHLIGRIKLPDPDDRHVLAAAIASGGDVIVTSNLKDFPKANLQKYDIHPLHPDRFTADLIRFDRESASIAFRRQVKRLTNPPKKAEDVLEALKQNKLPETVDLLKQLK